MTTVSFGEKIKDPSDIYPVELKNVMMFMQYSEKLEWLCQDIQNTQDKKERQQLKTKLQYFIPAWVMGSRHIKHFIKSNLMILDIDGMENETLMELRAKVNRNHFTHFSFISPSGKGLKVGIKLEDYVEDPATYTKVYRHLADKFSGTFSVDTDNTSDCVRACYLAYDPELYYNLNSSLWPLIQKMPEKIRPISSFSVKNDPDVDIDEEFKKAMEKARNSTVPNYHNWINCGMALKSYFGEKGLDVFKALSSGAGYNDSDNYINWKWKTFPDNSSVSIGTFYHLCG